jgi:hypothetical protein
MDVVSLRAGDKLTVSYMNDEISRESTPFPDDFSPDLVNSLTLIKICGNTLARYERLKSSPDDVVQGGGGGTGGGLTKDMRSDRAGRSALSRLSSPGGKSVKSGRRGKSDRHASDEESDGSPMDEFDYEMEEFDRSLTRTAHWTNPRNDFVPTPFQPSFSHSKSILEFPHVGQYLLMGRFAVGCRRDANFLPV